MEKEDRHVSKGSSQNIEIPMFFYLLPLFKYAMYKWTLQT